MDSNLQSQIINELVVIAGILTPLITAARKIWTSKVKGLVDAKTNAIQNADLRDAINDAFATCFDLIEQEITNAEITLKPAILQAIADGQVTTDELTSLNSIVKDKVLSHMTEDVKAKIATKIPNISAYLTSKVEQILSELKLDPNSVVSKTVLPEQSVQTVDTSNMVSKDEYQLVVDANTKLQAQVDAIKSQLLGSTTSSETEVTA